MTISTIRTPKGKMIHAMKGTIVYVSGQTGMAEVMCGREYTGITDEAESPEGVTCPRCHERLMAELAAELSEVEAQMATYGEPTVLSTPEAVQEVPAPIRRGMSPGRYRHGMIRLQRSERRRQMKGMLRDIQAISQG